MAHKKSRFLLLKKMLCKTLLCKFWEQGQCERGRLCRFAHGEAEYGSWRPAAPPPTVKSALCVFFMRGACLRGERCVWAHGEALEDRKMVCEEGS